MRIFLAAAVGLALAALAADAVPPRAAAGSALALFLMAALTDFVDGLAARRLGAVTAFGQVMDPVADKVLVSVTLVMLAGLGTVAGWALLAAVIVIGRDGLVSGWRELAARHGSAAAAGPGGKAKTAVQTAALGLLLASLVWPWPWLAPAGTALLWLAAAFAVISAAAYLRRKA